MHTLGPASHLVRYVRTVVPRAHTIALAGAFSAAGPESGDMVAMALAPEAATVTPRVWGGRVLRIHATTYECAIASLDAAPGFFTAVPLWRSVRLLHDPTGRGARLIERARQWNYTNTKAPWGEYAASAVTEAALLLSEVSAATAIGDADGARVLAMAAITALATPTAMLRRQLAADPTRGGLPSAVDATWRAAAARSTDNIDAAWELFGEAARAAYPHMTYAQREIVQLARRDSAPQGTSARRPPAALPGARRNSLALPSSVGSPGQPTW